MTALPRLILALACASSLARAADPAPAALRPLDPADRVVFLGDSITYGGHYVVDFETAWILRAGPRSPSMWNLGLSSETACGLSEPEHLRHGFPRPDVHERLARVLQQTKPTVVFSCYGMNDGLQKPFDEERFRAFQDGQRRLHDAVAAAGARIVHITPPVFDGPYDDVLHRYSTWLVARRADGWEVVDLHAAMLADIENHRATEPTFTYSRDKVHPNAAGHRVMAQSLWDAFGLGAPGPAELPSTGAVKELRAEVEKRSMLMRDAWLTATGHKRPGVPAGKPMEEARRLAAELDQRVAERATLARSPSR